ncbi:MAG: hypothetical protein P9M14_12640 [Candidatus Alcyoniella australis]|nr:hypothetical protein [Candidatus Alcyoniella australis]
MTDQDRKDRPDYLTPQVNQLSAEQLAAEEQLWSEVCAAELDQQTHNRYVGFCLRNSLIKTAIRRYSESVDDERLPIEKRRIARLNRQHLIQVIAIPTHAKSLEEQESKIWLGLVLPSVFGLVFGLTMTISLAGRWRAMGMTLTLLCTVILAGYLYYKARISDQLTGGGKKESR